MKNITLLNGNLMVKETERVDDNQDGFFIPKETMEDEQVSQGVVVRSSDADVPVGTTVLFHRVMPVDVHMKIDDDNEMKTYFFIQKKDLICTIT